MFLLCFYWNLKKAFAIYLKTPFLHLKQYLTNESPLKTMSLLFGYVEKWLNKNVMLSFKIYDVTDRTKNNYITHITQYLKRKR